MRNKGSSLRSIDSYIKQYLFYPSKIKHNSDNFFLLFLPDNLILTADHKTVKLADFGLAREETLTEMMTAETGTYRWMAPEVLLNC